MPYRFEAAIASILKPIGFTVGSCGGGEVTYELVGELTKKEQKRLQRRIAEACFQFDCYEIEDDEDAEDSD